MAQLLLDKNATVTICHSKTRNIDLWTRNADLIVCAVGKPRFLNCYSLHMPIIDVGINFDENGRLVGDCYNTTNRDVSPVPGGVGLLTRCMLLENVLEAANDNNK
jgi:methylenetetrahydrofolate dehydrogenase (NADP+)/methenyltetrahydrofolate cyclohydrolase